MAKNPTNLINGPRTLARRAACSPRMALVLLAVMVVIPSAAAEPGKDQSVSAPAKARTLAIVLYERFELLDVAGPAEIFGNVGPDLKVIMVADKAGPVRSTQGVSLVSQYSYADCPPTDLILVPGGIGTLTQLRHPPLLDWLKERSTKAEIVMSVCSGSGILAKAGLLDGRPATTNKQSFKLITAWRKEVKWIKEARWVDDGDRVTSSGVSAGVDMALAVVARLYGKDRAELIADLVEHEWNNDPARDPFSKFADNPRRIPRSTSSNTP